MTTTRGPTRSPAVADYGGGPERQSLTAPALLLQWLRTRLFELAILVWSAPFGLVILTYFQIHRSPAQVRWALRLWTIGFISSARWVLGVRYRIEGRDQIPDHPVIFVSNHQSYWESIAFNVLVPNLNIVTKAEAMDIPVFGWGLRYAPMIPVHRDRRGSNLRRIVRQSQESLAEGRSILLFPEGTRVKPGLTLAYERSLKLLYQKCGTDVVPVIHNAGLCWTKGFQTKGPGVITLRFLPPIPPGDDPNKVMDDVERLINREKDTLLVL